MLLRFILICLVLLVLVSLFRGLGFMLQAKPDNREKLVKALSLRIGLSLLLFLLLLIGWANGWWMPHRVV